MLRKSRSRATTAVFSPYLLRAHVWETSCKGGGKPSPDFRSDLREPGEGSSPGVPAARQDGVFFPALFVCLRLRDILLGRRKVQFRFPECSMRAGGENRPRESRQQGQDSGFRAVPFARPCWGYILPGQQKARPQFLGQSTRIGERTSPGNPEKGAERRFHPLPLWAPGICRRSAGQMREGHQRLSEQPLGMDKDPWGEENKAEALLAALLAGVYR